MHELFTKVLSKRDLSRAGDLFSVPDSEIVNDISEVLSDISPIISHPDYLKNNNDQSVVEICVTRVLSCIRETKTAERYCAALVDLLKTCLLWNLQPAGTTKEDPPHAKIAADIISSIFLNYDKKELMKISLPVAVQFLPKGNRELSRNLASYLSLAAIDYAYLLSPHVTSIMDSIMSGNFGLLRVLSQIYEVSPDEVSPHAPVLVALLPQCDSQEKLAVLQLYLLIAQKTPAVLENCVPRLCELLYDNETATITMQILLKISEQRPLLIVEHCEKIKAASKANPNTVSLAAQILASAGRTNKEHAQYALDFVLEHLPHADRTSQTNLLQEATKLCSSFPILFTDKVLACVRQKNALSQQKLSTSDINMDVSNKTSGGVTIVNLNSPTEPPPPAPTAAAAVVATVLNTAATANHSNVPNTSATSIPITADPVTSATTVSVAATTATTGRMHKSKNKSRSSPSSPKDGSRKALLSAHLKISTAQPTQPTAVNTNTTFIQQSHNAAVSGAPPLVPPTPPHTGYTRRVKLGDSRSTGRLHPTGNTHRSMTRLNVAGGSVGGLHKSMTRLSSSQHINQNGGSSSNNANNSQSSGNVVVQTPTGASTTTVGAGALPKTPTSPSSPGYVTPVPPLSNNVIITGHNKWGIPSTQVTSGGVTVTTSPTKVRPHSQGPTTLLNSSTALLKYSTDALNQSIGSISIPQNPVSVHHASPALPQQNNGNQKSVMKLPVNGNSTHEVIVSGPTTNMTPRRNNNNTSRTLLNANNSCILDQRMSTFEPYQIMRDPVQQFCEKHFGSIKSYMDDVSQSLPPPTRCSIEVSNEFAERRTKKVAKLHFACQIRGPHCMYSKACFTMRTRNPKTWIHLMFLDFQVRHYVKEKTVLSTREPGISNLKNIWQILKCENRSFTELVTSQFPNAKDREILVNELRHSGFLDVFEVSKTDTSNPNCNELEYQWGCLLCNHPDKAVGFLNGSNQPMIEGQLKEKKGKWRLFRRWRTRYFTLSGAHLSCKGSSGGESIDVNQIRSVKVSRGARNIPKAFEIFTADQTLILKPKDGKNAEEWVQCLSIVVAHSQARDNPTAKTNSLPARGMGSSKPSF
ncbi:protein melted isoform X1 [Bactrocera dorsalis]|uniref:Protein melted isoform X1 n=1 Tax=Bactrocera dorsalis TaxID=27457 RepID=A0ABM3JVW2_BACDO|nr:protein melted isoform X1 [Bactrocera dorsalis]XP_049313360.1 protein melted isoform X1 [Bactrocera dorsalis]XP_049313361.1 protein melted isoform X1 [Bactrocera dorsalis]XP_049313362.1 protein melted isoform X1 [Bactrocera dorsalis]